MPENRFYAPIKLKNGDIIEVGQDEHSHLQVMRKKIGDPIELVNGKNQLAQGVIQSMGKKNTLAQILAVETSPPPPRQLILAQPFLRPKNLDLVIEKGTELGATAFWLFPSDKSDKKSLTPTQVLRLKNLTIAAMKQCGRLDLPPIQLYPSINELVTKPSASCFVADPQSRVPYVPTKTDTILIVGPESGFSAREIYFLNSFATAVCIHNNILRAETASLCFLSIN